MTKAEITALRAKYNPDKMRAIRGLYDRDVQAWGPIVEQYNLDIQCISTERGPWPEIEWNARKARMQACLHEDVLTPYVNQVVNKIEQNPMGIECQPSGDEATEESAEKLENRIRQKEYEENGEYAYQTAVKSATEGSFGWWKSETKYAGKFYQTYSIVPIMDPTTVTPGFFKKPDASDMRRAWEHEWMTVDEYVERWPHAQIRSFEAMRDAGGAWSHEGLVQVCAWWHLEGEDRELLMIEDGEGFREVYSDEVSEFPALDESKVSKRRKVTRQKVLKTILSGLEPLDETECIDPGTLDAEGEQIEPPEIPLFGVFGRIKYEHGKMVIESLVRKGRIGQMLYDSNITAKAEVVAMTPKVSRSGPEGTFDTTSNWDPRALTVYREWKPVTDPETNQALPGPVVEVYEPPIQALEIDKQSILIGIQNAIGMSAVERKDKAAKSGKALESLQEEMTVGTSHYFAAKRVAQERSYRMQARIIPVLEQPGQMVGFRDKFGKHSMEKLEEGAYRGRFAIAVGAGKLYQTLQEKQEELSQELLQTKDPTVSMAVLPSAIRMRGTGPEGDKLADMLEAMQPPQMQAARNQGKDGQQAPIPPEVQQAMTQAQEQMKSLDAYAKEAEKKIIELEDQIQGQVVQNESKKEIAAADNDTKIRLQEMKDEMEMRKLEFEFRMKELELEIERMRANTMLQKTGAELGSKEALAQHQTDHAETEAERNRRHASGEAERGREHEKETAKTE